MKNDSAGVNRDTIIRKSKENMETLRGVEETPTEINCSDSSRLNVNATEEEAEAKITNFRI